MVQMQVSGTTATVAVLIGWELTVANVGDSCAYLDTGSEVLQVSIFHHKFLPASVKQLVVSSLQSHPEIMSTSRQLEDFTCSVLH